MTFSLSRGGRVLAVAGATATLTGGLLAGTAQAATVAGDPSPSWGAFATCTTQYTVKNPNCAQVRATAYDPATGDLIVGGAFSELIDPTGKSAPVAANNLAAIKEATGAPDTAFADDSFNGAVYALAVLPGGNLLVGGAFSKINGKGIGALHLAELSPAGAVVATFKANLNGAVKAVLGPTGPNGDIYVGGDFTKAGTTAVTDVAALNPTTGAVDPGFAPSLASTQNSAAVEVRSLAYDAGTGRLYLGGHFDTVNGQTRYSVVAVDPTTGATDRTFNPVIEQPTPAGSDTLQAIDQIVPVGGANPGVILAQAGHYNRGYRDNLDGTRVWTLLPDGDVQTAQVSADGSTVYFGGHFVCVQNCYNGEPNPVDRTHIVAVSYASLAPATANGGKPAPLLDPNWYPKASPVWQPYFYGVWSLDLLSNGDLWAGGVFDYVYGTTGTKYNYAKLTVFRGL